MSLPERSKRIGDAERNHALEQLSRLTGTGHLDLGEFEERSVSVAVARTRGDLDAVLADLPVETAAAAPGVPATAASGRAPELRDTRKIAGLALSWVAIFVAAAALGLPWLMLLAPVLILGVWLSGRGPSGFYED